MKTNFHLQQKPLHEEFSAAFVFVKCPILTITIGQQFVYGRDIDKETRVGEAKAIKLLQDW